MAKDFKGFVKALRKQRTERLELADAAQTKGFSWPAIIQAADAQENLLAASDAASEFIPAMKGSI